MKQYQNLDKYKNPPGIRGASLLKVLVWRAVYAGLFRPSPKFLWGFRRFLLRLFGATVGNKAEFAPTCKITYPWFLETEEFCWVGDETVIYNLAKIKLGNHVALAHRVYLCCGSHDVSKDSFDIIVKTITIHDEVWIANDVFIAAGVVVGRGVVIGARSSVYKDLEAGFIYAGNPVAQIKKRDTEYV